MNQMATLTSKRQLTIPAVMFKQLGLRTGEKVIISVDNETMRIESAVALVKRLAGSVKVPKHLQNRNLDELIEESKELYFQSKYRSKQG